MSGQYGVGQTKGQVVIVTRVADLEHPAPGSVITTCDFCRHNVWRTPASSPEWTRNTDKPLAHIKNATLVCTVCERRSRKKEDA